MRKDNLSANDTNNTNGKRTRIDRDYMGWEIEKGRRNMVILIVKNVVKGERA